MTATSADFVVELDWDDVETIIASEIQRFGVAGIRGYVQEDLAQECRLAVSNVWSKVQRGRHGARTYVRQIARNRLSYLLTRYRTLGRCPHDAYGRPITYPTGYDHTVSYEAPMRGPEDVMDQQRAVSELRARLDPRDWDQLLGVFLDGARIAKGRSNKHAFSLVHAQAQAILRRIGYRVSREQESTKMSAETIPQPDNVPECHANGEAPIGYDVEDYACVQCQDKFTCLPQAIAKKIIDGDLTVDLEVAAVHGSFMTYDVGLQRMVRRLHKEQAGEQIADDEKHDFPGLLPDGKPVPKPKSKTPPETTTPEPEPASPATQADSTPENEEEVAKPKKKPVKAKKPAKKNPPKKPVKAKAKKPAKKKGVGIGVDRPKKPTKKPVKTKASYAPVLGSDPRGPFKFLIVVDGIRKGRIEYVEGDGWGWWTRTSESPEWLKSYSAALTGIHAELREDFPKLRFSENAKTIAKEVLQKWEKTQASKPARGSSRKAPADWPRMRDGRPYPAPRQLSEEEMAAKMDDAQSRLGANIQLEYGMQLVRRTRKGEVIAVLTPRGFEHTIEDKALVKKAGFKSATQTFGSLSAIAMWFEGRLRTGNDFFNLAKHACTEIRSKDHRIVDRKGGAPGAR